MSSAKSVPFLDLVTPHVELEEELGGVFRKTLHSANFVGGSMVKEFEASFAQFCGVEHAVAVGSGTDALRFALAASGIRQGDVVLTVPHSFIATTEAISQVGALPEFVDIDEQTYNMSVEKLREYLEQRCTRDKVGRLISFRSNRPVTAIVPVHLYGQMADMDGILSLADEYGLMVIEDACQAHGAQYFSRKLNRWMKPGSMSHAAAFSFYPGKNLGACGEAGAAVSNDSEIAASMLMLREHGQSQKYFHELEGYNGRLDAMQAGFLQVKLAYLEKWNEQRRERAAEYDRLLAGNDAVIRPFEPSWSRAVYHLYVIRTENREFMMEHLNAAGIGTGIHYPVPLHMQKAYAWLNYRPSDLPIARRIASEILSLPMFPQLIAEQQAYVVQEVCECAEQWRRARPNSDHAVTEDTALIA